jgi:ribosomal RNA-processing protein 9
MSSFFTLPASQKKRKRNEGAPASAPKRSRNTESKPARKSRRDESISGSDTDLSGDGKEVDDVPQSSDEDTDSDEEETGAERRLKLAERYLENVKSQVAEQQAIGFDAEDIDRDLIAERLKEDVAETKGRLYRFIASDYDYASASMANFRFDTHCVTSIAACAPYAYTVSHDLCLTKWQLPRPSIYDAKKPKSNMKMSRTRPTKLLSTKGNRHKSYTLCRSLFRWQVCGNRWRR